MQQQKLETNDQRERSVPTLRPDATECMELLSNWNQSLLGFYFARVQDYWRMPLEIPSLSSADDYINLHQRFLDKMVADYSGQAAKLLEIASSDLGASFDQSPTDYNARLLKAQKDAAEIIDQAKAQAEHIIAEAEARAGQTNAEPGKRSFTPKRRKSA